MPWKAMTPMSQRKEFVTFAKQDRIRFAALCDRFGISRKTGYKWLQRYETEGEAGLCERSRKPLHSPDRTDLLLTQAILDLRDCYPAWGARKLRAVLERRYPERTWPAPSTVQAILKRNDRIAPDEGRRHTAFVRFERENPNELWQMDFKGHFQTRAGVCHPLTCLDDHSRFNLILNACPNQRETTVRPILIAAFRRYGLPDAILTDNGGPWGDTGHDTYSRLQIWLMHLDIRLSHARPYHPQTQGKEERFHRTLTLELLSRQIWRDLKHCQDRFDGWRDLYNLERPHEALHMKTPAQLYHPSTRSFPERLPPIEYPTSDIVRQGRNPGRLRFKGRDYKIPIAFCGYPLAIRPTTTDGLWDVYFRRFRVLILDERGPGPQVIHPRRLDPPKSTA